MFFLSFLEDFEEEIKNPEIIFLGQNSGGYLIYDNYEGVILIDPHAAHERINYEKIKKLALSRLKSSNGQKLTPNKTGARDNPEKKV